VPGPHQVTATVLTCTDQVPGVLLVDGGTDTGVNSSRRNRRARWTASLTSVLTRSPEGRWSFEGATTSQRIPAAFNDRGKPNPVGPGLVAHRHRARQVTQPGPDVLM
jgi:hypothetical protein